MKTRHRYLPALLALGGLLLAGCTAAPQQPQPTVNAAAALAHIHDLAIDQQNHILIATHDGIYRLPPLAGGGTPTGPLGDAHFDAMSFTSSGDTMFASGHPSPASPEAFQAPNIGVMRSTGGNDDWTNTSLGGKVDFHALTTARVDAATTIYGLDAATGQVLRSEDSGNTWTSGATIDAMDLAAQPGKADALYATTRAGIAISTDSGKSFTIDTTAPILNQIGFSTDGTIYGTGPDGYLWQKTDRWQRGEVFPGTPQAFTVSANEVIVATDRGIFSTADLGNQWKALWRP